MLSYILIALAAIVVVFVVVVAMRPSEFRVARSAAISGPASDAFALVNDFHQWPKWSPYEKLDPAMKKTYEGSPAGTGAIYNWAGNAKAGAGRVTITESRPHDLIRIKLEMFKPFAGTNAVEFTFLPQGNQTVATWAMTGRYNFIAKAMCMFMNMDKMIGGEFEKGLANLKSLVESSPASVAEGRL